MIYYTTCCVSVTYRWDKDNGKIASGLDSGPLVLFNQQSDALVISPFSQFMAWSAVYDTDRHTATWGLLGNAASIPQDFECWTVAFYSPDGINMVCYVYFVKCEFYCVLICKRCTCIVFSYFFVCIVSMLILHFKLLK